MKIQDPLLAFLLLTAPLFAADLPQSRAEHEFRTSVLRQLQKADLLTKYDSAENVSAQMISWASLDECIDEKHIRPKSEKCVLSAAQRQLLRDVLSDDTSYTESRLNCRCIFEPLLRISFVPQGETKKCDIFFDGYGHGYLRAFEDGKGVASSRTRLFLTRLFQFLDRTFPKHNLVTALHRDFQRRSKEEVGKPNRAKGEEPGQPEAK